MLSQTALDGTSALIELLATPTTPHVDHRVKRASSCGLVTSVFRQKHGGAEQE
jgi:hypothetical protein